ncbi:MAG: 3-methyladenine DNA glycosylase AlkC [Ilumatobacter sp.]|jgi:3-methyladenine DNA glycosylase AlkC
MAEPLKNSYGPKVPQYIADLVGTMVPRFPRKRFLEVCHRTCRAGRAFAISPLAILSGITEHHALSMVALRELTIRFTSEFAIRPFLEHQPAATLAQSRQWTTHDSEHVRRLVSEGTRPHLPWGSRLRSFMADPSAVIELLEILKDDTSEYVRRSDANNINDIAKDHPEVVVDLARRWWLGASEDRKRLVKNALRTLIKQGNTDAFAVIGYGPNSPLVISASGCVPEVAAIGEKTQLSAALKNPTDDVSRALVDFRIDFVKANGSTSPKVFNGAEVDVEGGATTVVKKTISLKVHTTRTPYAGTHDVEVLINGDGSPLGSFELTAD